MKIERCIDVEEEIRANLAGYITTYVKPLPKDFSVPSILVTAVGGTEANTIDTFDVTLDSRAENEEEALTNLRNAVGILKEIAKSQQTALRYVTINTLGSWGRDPVRPELALCSSRVRVVAHIETVEV